MGLHFWGLFKLKTHLYEAVRKKLWNYFMVRSGLQNINCLLNVIRGNYLLIAMKINGYKKGFFDFKL